MVDKEGDLSEGSLYGYEVRSCKSKDEFTVKEFTREI